MFLPPTGKLGCIGWSEPLSLPSCNVLIFLPPTGNPGYIGWSKPPSLPLCDNGNTGGACLSKLAAATTGAGH